MPPKGKNKENEIQFLQKQTSRREMLRGSATLAGSAFLAHLFPRRCSAPPSGNRAQAPSPLPTREFSAPSLMRSHEDAKAR